MRWMYGNRSPSCSSSCSSSMYRIMFILFWIQSMIAGFACWAFQSRCLTTTTTRRALPFSKHLLIPMSATTTNDSTTEQDEIVAMRIVVSGPAVNNGYYRACVNNEVSTADLALAFPPWLSQNIVWSNARIMCTFCFCEFPASLGMIGWQISSFVGNHDTPRRWIRYCRNLCRRKTQTCGRICSMV